MSKTDFDHWQERFAQPGYRFGTAPNAFLKSQAHLLRKGQSALAIADGEGRNGVFLAEQGLDVLSVDFSPLAQEKRGSLPRSAALRCTSSRPISSNGRGRIRRTTWWRRFSSNSPRRQNATRFSPASNEP
jgi:hypothetical protein